jgi:D-alanine-D-alanine ligase
MRVAVVRNLARAGVANALGRPYLAPAGGDAVETTVDALREEGHTVMTCEGNPHLLGSLARFMPPPGGGDPGGFVFNLARGIYGDCARSHVPAMLEMAGVPYTGPSPIGHAITSDGVATRALLHLAGVPVAPYRTTGFFGFDAEGLRYPLTVLPRNERPELAARIARTPGELSEAVQRVFAAGEDEAIVEERVGGAAVAAALLGNDDEIEMFPLGERIGDEPGQVPAAPALPPALARRVGAMAMAAFRACRCQDYAVVGIRLDAAGDPVVAFVDTMPSLDRDGEFVHAAVSGGYSRSALAARILDVAHRRYFGVDAPRFEVPAQFRTGIWRPGPVNEAY